MGNTERDCLHGLCRFMVAYSGILATGGASKWHRGGCRCKRIPAGLLVGAGVQSTAGYHRKVYFYQYLIFVVHNHVFNGVSGHSVSDGS